MLQRAEKQTRLALRQLLIITLITMSTTSFAAPSKTAESAKKGAMAGAAFGLLLGALSGNADIAVEIAVEEAAAGSADEAYKSHRENKRARELEQIDETGKPTTVSIDDVEASEKMRKQLDRFLGVWSLQGWARPPGGERIEVSARVDGNKGAGEAVELRYKELKTSNREQPIRGVSSLTYSTTRGFNIISRFSTLQEPIRTENGEFNQAAESFLFTDADYTVLINFSDAKRYTLETREDVGGKSEVVESYVFTAD